MQNSQIEVHPLTNDPTAAWKEISQKQKIFKLNVKLPSKPVEPNKMSVPDGDVFIHAGDFTKCGQRDEVKDFNKWLGELPHKYKIVIAGNHELSFDPTFVNVFKKSMTRNSQTTDSVLNFAIKTFLNVFRKPFDHSARHTGSAFEDDVPTLEKSKDSLSDAVNAENIKQYLTNCIYLEDSAVDIYGVKIYGSPWQPEFGNWAFNVPRGEKCLLKWDKIPEDTDILITHTPPVGHGDLVCSGVRTGCVELLSTVQHRVKPKYHVFGHIHEGYGITSDGKIIYINASTCDINYIPNNLPLVFDMSLPPGREKISSV